MRFSRPGSGTPARAAGTRRRVEAAEDFRRADQVAPIVAELERQGWTPPAPPRRRRSSTSCPRAPVRRRPPSSSAPKRPDRPGLASGRPPHRAGPARRRATGHRRRRGPPAEVAEFLVDVRRLAEWHRARHRYLPDHLRITDTPTTAVNMVDVDMYRESPGSVPTVSATSPARGASPVARSTALVLRQVGRGRMARPAGPGSRLK